MKYQKIVDVLHNGTTQLSRSRTKNWAEINDDRRGLYNKKPLLRRLQF